MLYDMTMKNEKSKEQDDYVSPESENFPLTYEGLLANKQFLIQQRESGNPEYKYKGNCTKKFADAIVDKFFAQTWAHIKSMPLPSNLEFPIKDSSLVSEIKSLVHKDLSWKARSPLIRKFHAKTFVTSNRNDCLTPVDAWKKLQDDENAFRHFYHNRLRCSDWFNERDKSGKHEDNRPYLVEGYVPDFIFAIGLDTSRKAPFVSYFKPALAKYLVKKYLSEFSEVYDPFSGLSGRLLGTVACGKKYIGRDLNKQAINESIQLMSFAEEHFKKNGIVPQFDLRVGDAKTETGTYESVLMCSPYGMSEQWCGIASSESCDDWLDIVIKNIRCKRLVAVVDDTIVKYRKHIKERLDNFSHFGTNFEDVVVIDFNADGTVKEA